jgi:hypothetical protein
MRWWVEYQVNPGVRIGWCVVALDPDTALAIAAQRYARLLGQAPDPMTLLRVAPWEE